MNHVHDWEPAATSPGEQVWICRLCGAVLRADTTTGTATILSD